MKLLIVNPNTCSAMTRSMTASAQALAAPGTDVTGRQPSFGPASIEGHFDEAFGAANACADAVIDRVIAEQVLGFTSSSFMVRTDCFQLFCT